MKQCKLGRHNEINVTFDNKTYDYVGFMVYAIIFPDGKEYIGRTCRLNERVKQHIRNLYGKRTPVGREMDRQRKFKVKNLRICHSESEVKRVEYDTIYNRSMEIVSPISSATAMASNVASAAGCVMAAVMPDTWSTEASFSASRQSIMPGCR